MACIGSARCDTMTSIMSVRSQYNRSAYGLEEAGLSVDSILVGVEVSVHTVFDSILFSHICQPLFILFDTIVVIVVILIYLSFLNSEVDPSACEDCSNQYKDGVHQAHETDECKGAAQVESFGIKSTIVSRSSLTVEASLELN